MQTTKLTNGLLIAFATVSILIFGKPLIIPFIIALIFWFLIKEIRNLLNKIPFVQRRISNDILNLVGFVLIFAILGGVVKILMANIQQLSTSMPLYQSNIKIILRQIDEMVPVDLMSSTQDFIGNFKYNNIFTKVLNAFKDIFGKAILIIIYTIFLMLEERFFGEKIKAIYFKKENYDEITNMLNQIDLSIGRYLSIKTIISFMTGILSYIALIFIGIEAPLFWAFLIFIMNYIPAIGSLIATLFPAIFAMLQFGEVMPGVWVLIIVGAIQLIIGNYVDPKLTGDSLNVSPLIVILGLSFWGAIWGVMGMILSVPIAVMLILIFANIPSLRGVAILLSKQGNISKVQRNIPK